MANETASDKGNNDKQHDKGEAPEGFTERVGREQGVGWIIKGEGVTVQGRLLGRFIGSQKDDDGKYQSFYQVRLDLPVKVKSKNRETGEEKEITAKKGDVINIGEHKALEDLSPRTRDGGVYDVWFKYLKETKVPNSNRTFWNVKGPFLKVIKPATHAPTPEVVKRDDEQTDAPF